MEHIGILTLLALVLATYRLTRLVVADQFPFEPLRTKKVGTNLGYLLTCPFCVSVWVGGFLSAGHGVAGSTWAWQVFIGALALSGIISLAAALVPQLFD